MTTQIHVWRVQVNFMGGIQSTKSCTWDSSGDCWWFGPRSTFLNIQMPSTHGRLLNIHTRRVCDFTKLPTAGELLSDKEYPTANAGLSTILTYLIILASSVLPTERNPGAASERQHAKQKNSTTGARCCGTSRCEESVSTDTKPWCSNNGNSTKGYSCSSKFVRSNKSQWCIRKWYVPEQ